MKILVTGANGLLGSHIINQAAQDRKAEAVGTTRTGAGGFAKMDLGSAKEIRHAVSSFSPDVVINTAALTNVDYCEDHREEAWSINVEGTRALASECREIGAKLVHVSTDYVFDGNGGMYKETDETSPVQYYGKTKLEAEKAIVGSGIEYLIVRPAIIYGWGNGKLNYVTWVIDSLLKGQKIQIFDQYNSPTYAGSLAEALLKITDKTGLYHLAGPQRISRHEFAMKVAEAFGLDSSLIVQARDNSFAKAARPHDSSLDVSKAAEELGMRLHDIGQGLMAMQKGRL